MEAGWKDDLPEGLGPMTVKELRQSLRRGSFVLPFIGIQVLALVAMIAEFRMGHGVAASDWLGALNPWILAKSGPFWMVVGAICMGILPLGGLMLMGQEMEEGNHELLQLTRLDRTKVVLGKFFALWGLSVVTFVSLLPYVVVRYLVGGVEWWHEASCAATVLGGSAMLGAGAIGASSFRGAGARAAVFLLFLFSMAAACGVALLAAGARGGGAGVIYHITAVSAVLCYTVAGLTLARSRLRVAFMAYEVKPGSLALVLLVFAPFVVGMITAITLGFGGGAGLLLIAVAAARGDAVPRFSGAPARPAGVKAAQDVALAGRADLRGLRGASPVGRKGATSESSKSNASEKSSR